MSDAASIVERTTIADVYRADKQLAGIVKKTKLIQSDFFSEQCGNSVYL
ncbi:MAG: threonine ammonia-lyase, partial [Selenomonadaceae bacterium]|nr:threonine ammonia-lyase [Selenomonadaceae bacterium]